MRTGLSRRLAAVAAFAMVLGAGTANAQMDVPFAPAMGGGAPSPAPRAAAPQVSSQVSPSRRSEAGFLGGKWYGSLEMRHHLNTYYDNDGYYAHQEPSTHARIQLGAQFYDGAVDAYLTLGVFKIPETQQIMQRRPELALDFYPVRSTYFSLQQYNLVQLPVKDDATVPVNEDDRAEGQVNPGAIYTVGLAPTAKFPFQAFSSKFEVKGGLDGWTRLYSQKQYVGGETLIDEDESRGDDSLALVDEEGEPIEDYAMHYRSQVFGGMNFVPGATKELTIEGSAHYQSRFDPRYARNEDGNVEYEYAATRYSYYRARLRYELTERIAITNDFYHFHDGAFAGKRKGDDRRFRNIARLSCKL